MRYGDIINEHDYSDEYYELQRDYRAGTIDQAEYLRLKAELDRKSGADQPQRARYRAPISRGKTWFKDVPYELAKKNKLRWDPEQKMWFKDGYSSSVYDPFELRPYNQAHQIASNFNANTWVADALSSMTDYRNHPFVKAHQAQQGVAQAPVPTPQPQSSQGSSDVKMTHLHYFNGMTDQDAQDFAAMKLKKDKNGRWYLPQYNKSGQTFQNNFNTLSRTFGQPKTIALK